MLNVINYFRKKLHLSCLAGVWVRLDIDLKLGLETKHNRRDKKSSLKLNSGTWQELNQQFVNLQLLQDLLPPIESISLEYNQVYFDSNNEICHLMNTKGELEDLKQSFVNIHLKLGTHFNKTYLV